MTRPRRTKKIKQVPYKKLLAEAIRVHSNYIRQRDNYTCYCGFRGDRRTIDNGHLITRRNKAVLFDDMNTHASCKGCNYLHNYRPEKYTVWFVKTYGQEEYLKLVFRSSAPPKKIPRDVLEKIITTYTQRLEELKAS